VFAHTFTIGLLLGIYFEIEVATVVANNKWGFMEGLLWKKYSKTRGNIGCVYLTFHG